MKEIQTVPRSQLPEWVHDLTGIYQKFREADLELRQRYGSYWQESRYRMLAGQYPNDGKIEEIVRMCGSQRKDALCDLNNAVINLFGKNSLPQRLYGGSLKSEPNLRDVNTVFFLPRENRLVLVPHSDKNGIIGKLYEKVGFDTRKYNWNQASEAPISQWCYTILLAREILFPTRSYIDYIEDPEYPYS